jgi:hypothetical protein
MQGRDEVVVFLAVLVVGRRALLQDLAQGLGVERRGRANVEQGLGKRQQVASVAVGQGHQGVARLRLQRQGLALKGLGLGEQAQQGVVVQPLEHEDLGAGQQGPVELERGVLGGRADQRHDPLLHEGQEAILLGAVEAVDLVDEEQGALASGAAHARLLEGLLQVGDAGEDRRQLLEFIAGLLGQQAGDGGLAGAGRAPQDHRGQPLGLSHPADGPVGTQEVILAHDLVQLLRTQAVGERRRLLRRQAGGGEQIGHGRAYLKSPPDRSVTGPRGSAADWRRPTAPGPGPARAGIGRAPSAHSPRAVGRSGRRCGSPCHRAPGRAG